MKTLSQAKTKGRGDNQGHLSHMRSEDGEDFIPCNGKYVDQKPLIKVTVL